MKKKKNLRKWIIGIVIAAVLLFTALIRFITDYLWFKELGYVSVFFKELVTQLEFGIPAFIVITAIAFFYLLGLKKGYYKKVDIEDMSATPEKRVNFAALGVSMVFGLIVAIAVAGSLWFQILQYINSTDFGIADPIFDRDVSFYIFKLEFITRVNGLLIGILLGFAAVIVVFYLILLVMRKPRLYSEGEASSPDDGEPQRNWQSAQNNLGDMFGGMFSGMFGGAAAPPRPPKQQPRQMDKGTMKELLGIASNQLKVLGVLFFLAVGFNFFLKQYTLLYTSSSGVVYGAGFANINVTLWMYRLLVVLALVAAVMFVIGVSKRKLRTTLIAPLAMIAVLILGGVATSLVQNLIVDPDEINKEYEYLENNIAFTRYAYDLQDITIREFAATNDLSLEDVLNNAETIANIRINDYEPAEKFYNQTQSIRLYYKFTDVDVDRYMVDGDYTQVFLSAREIDEAAITDQWLSTHLKYTHGYGITLSRVDKVTESGQPDMLIDSIPPISDVPEIQITRPEIYFGENTDNYIIVNTDELEFDYPSGDNNVYSTYEGNAGIKLNLFNRLLFAIREGSIKLLVSTNINADSNIIINRNIVDRVQQIAPFLSYDDDPYIVSADGGLYWIIDAYTISSYYPYSEPYTLGSSVNYIRNSVKVVIDAYNGDTNFYLVDDSDPIAVTLQKIYPSLFKDFSAMPEGLQSHIRYPNTLFTIQANVYTKYHMTDVNVFYQNEDGWDIATEVYGTETTTMTPNYYIMKLPGEQDAEFINSVPYTPTGKFNMTALLIARNDGENYGELVLFQLPKDRIIYGPQQIEAQINQHTEIAQDFTLWSSAGSTYTRGNLFVVPIETSLMYVEPIYLESANSSLPEVKRVIIYYDERIAYAETLAEALEDMFGEGASAVLSDTSLQVEDVLEQLAQNGGESGGISDGEDTEGTAVVTPELSFDELAQKANEAYESAVSAQRNGDWAAYGRYLQQLEEYLRQLVGEEETAEDQEAALTTDINTALPQDAGSAE
ncbi:MAG: UPF0182 family protein [Bacillota bacterium]|nr:UPF0182 family protein [Bacillota bacterium]